MAENTILDNPDIQHSIIKSPATEAEVKSVLNFLLTHSRDPETISCRNLKNILDLGAVCYVTKERLTRKIVQVSIEITLCNLRQVIARVPNNTHHHSAIENNHVIYTYDERKSNFSSRLCRIVDSMDHRIFNVFSKQNAIDNDLTIFNVPLSKEEWNVILRSGSFIVWKIFIQNIHSANVILMSTLYEDKLSHKMVHFRYFTSSPSQILDYILYCINTLGSHILYSYSTDTTQIIF